jgi:hypothetical protein
MRNRIVALPLTVSLVYLVGGSATLVGPTTPARAQAWNSSLTGHVRLVVHAGPLARHATSSKFKVLGARIEQPHSEFDWSLSRTLLKKVQVGSKVRLTIYWKLNKATVSSRFVATFVLKRGTNVVFRQPFNGRVSHGKSGEIWEEAHVLSLPKTPGGYRFKGQIALGGKTQSAKTDFTVTKAKAQSGSASFTLTSVRLLNSQLHPQSKFRPGDRFWVSVAWTTAELKGRQKVSIAVVFIDPSSKQAIFAPSGYEISAGPGNQSSRFSFLAPRQSVRIDVAITIADTTKSKSTLLSLK